MSSRPVDPDADICSLPQCGFGDDIHFDSLIDTNRFLYRVYTPKERSPFADDTDPFFIAPRFDELVARSPVDLPKVKFFEPLIGSYADVAQHMDWTTRTSSCYVSTSFSFAWSIWEAVRRYHQGVKKDVEIAIIDSTALGGRAATALQLLQKSSPEERTDQFWKWYRFSQDSQAVLVYAMIPRTAVLASIPLLQILRKMPSYFLRKDIQTIPGNPLDLVAWNYALRKQSYRHFCQELSALFLGRPAEIRLRDSTAGAVRLALGFLRPFFHHVVQEDFDIAITYLRNLAITISVWPGGKWARDQPEVRQIIDTMVLAIGEELKEKYFNQKQGEIKNLQLVIDGLQHTIEIQGEESKFVLENIEVDSNGEGDFELDLPESEEPTLVAGDLSKSLQKPPSLELSVAVTPRIPVTFQTPITPPESPRNSIFLPSIAAPRAVIPLPMLVSFVPAPEETIVEQQTSEIASNKASPMSDEPASPPPTPPATSPDLSFSMLPVLEVPEKVLEESAVQDDAVEYLGEQSLAQEAEEVQQPEDECDALHGDGDDYNTELVFPPVQLEHGPAAVEDYEHDEHDDDAETELELEQEEEHFVEPSPSGSWVRVRPKLTSFSSISSASSITSIETLCDLAEFPSKRISLVSNDSYEIVPPFSAFRSLGAMSRTISFSELESSPKLPQPMPLPELIQDVHEIPLPPSPSATSESLLPLDSSPSTPRPTSTTPSRSSSPRPLISLSPHPSTPSTPQPPSPLELHLPQSAADVILPPRKEISLLAALPSQAAVTEEERDAARTATRRSAVIVDAASYAVTGFLIGAFITLFLFSTQRKTLMVLT
ncbi:hypothetical protein D9613_010999 [Agrocybe pediades]|uniref:DUF7587 domain-containing protein n=1 Tax=Agrocybe pediades TaxID=84607 RepID=A0A8H4QL97_9AGAR|nr:hypothetical protein D9613_010999 [Agrocybe pediades]